MLYNLGGGLANLLVAGVLMPPLALAGNHMVKALLLAGVFASLLLGLMNLLPLPTQLPNDGRNILTALQCREAKRGLWLMLRLNKMITRGRRYREIDPALIAAPQNQTGIRNYFAAYSIFCEAARLYDLGRYDESMAVYTALDLPRLHKYYRCSVNMDLLYYYLIHRPDPGRARAIYESKEMQRFLRLKIPTQNRVLAACAFYLENAPAKAVDLLETAEAEAKAYPSIGLRLMEADYLAHLRWLIAPKPSAGSGQTMSPMVN